MRIEGKSFIYGFVIGAGIFLPMVFLAATLVRAGEPGPDDTGGIPLRGPEAVHIVPLVPLPLVKPEVVTTRPVGSFEFVRNCSDERLPGYDPYGPACDDRALPTETEITFEPPVAVAPPTPIVPMPMMPCNRAHCDD